MKIKYFSVYVSVLAISLCLASCNTGSKSTEYDTESATEVVESEAPAPALSGDLTIDTENSTVKWKGEMMGMYAHEGTLKFSEGTITMADGQVTGGNFVVEMGSMTPTDENFNPEEGKTKEKLVGHLSSGDFFDVENNPTASFTLSDNQGNGKLMIRGKEGEESVENIVLTTEGDQVMVSGKLKFDRKNYDVAFDHPMQEMVISDDIELNIELIASK